MVDVAVDGRRALERLLGGVLQPGHQGADLAPAGRHGAQDPVSLRGVLAVGAQRLLLCVGRRLANALEDLLHVAVARYRDAREDLHGRRPPGYLGWGIAASLVIRTEPLEQVVEPSVKLRVLSELLRKRVVDAVELALELALGLERSGREQRRSAAIPHLVCGALAPVRDGPKALLASGRDAPEQLQHRLAGGP